MKKIALCAAFCALFAHLGFAQNAYHDALRLRQCDFVALSADSVTMAKLGNACAVDYQAILQPYLSDPSEPLEDAFADNPFFGPDQGKSKIQFGSGFKNSAQPGGPESSMVIPARPHSQSPVTNIADGLAKFFVRRVKQELTIAFFQDFQQKVAQDPLKTLFPATTDRLKVIGDEVYQVNLYIKTLRGDFVADMKTLPTGAKNYLTKKDVFAKEPHKKILVGDLLSLSQMLVDDESPDEMIRFLARDIDLQNPALRAVVGDNAKRAELENLAAGFQILQLLSESLRSTEGAEIWVGPRELAQVVGDEKTFYLYLGLLWQKSDGVKFSDGSDLRAALGKFAKNLGDLRTLRLHLQNFSTQGKALSQSLTALRGRTFDKPVSYDDWLGFFTNFFDLLQTGIEFKRDFMSTIEPGKNTALDNVFIGSLRHLSQMNFDVRQRRYTAAIPELLGLFDLLLPQNDFKRNLFKYGQFIASVAEAEDSEQVAAAIEAVALPVGSSVLKKQSKFSVTLNGYTGLAGGGEQLEVPDSTRSSWFAAVSAPLGFAANWGFRERGSLSLFVPVIDVGALAAFRFRDDASNLPELKWGNIIAPGAYLAYGFGKGLPLTAGIGAQLGPNLRKISSTDTELANGWRYGVFFSVDIPIFNLYGR